MFIAFSTVPLLTDKSATSRELRGLLTPEGLRVQTPTVQIEAGRPRNRFRWNQRVTYRAEVRCLTAR